MVKSFNDNDSKVVNMIILGDRYSFTDLELERLKRQFPSITKISYKDTSAMETIESIAGILEQKQYELILLNTRAKLADTLLTYLTKLELQGVSYMTLENFFETYLHKCYITQDTNVHAFLEEVIAYSSGQYIQKRIVDLLGVLFLSPLALIAIGMTYFKIRSESPGPLFFYQKRIGRGGKEFCCIKLRSMHVEAEKEGAQFATENDSRAFEWGKTIRKRKWDELMQIWNVAKGEMHLVGPRPERKVWIDKFEKVIPFYMQRHVVAPGITGLAQVKYPYGSTVEDAEQKLMYDLYYIKHWSLKLELQVMWKTTQFIVTKKKENLATL